MTEMGSRASLVGERPRSAPRPALAEWGIRLGWVVVLAPFVLEAISIVRSTRAFFVLRLPDDAFYYLEIARRIEHGQGFTFDAVHATNGFHPLWQFVLAAIGLVVGGSDAFVKAAMLANLACLLGATLLTIRLVWRWIGPGPALMGAIVVVHGRDAMLNYVDGMEACLSLLTLTILATLLVRWFRRPSTGNGVLVGVASAAVVLARLDLVVVIWMVPAVMVLRGRSLRPAWPWLAGSAAALPWAVWFWFRYHHVLTTSATVKAHEMSAYARDHFGGRLTTGYADFALRTATSNLRSILGTANDSLLSGRGPITWVSTILVTGLAVAFVGVLVVAAVRARGAAGPVRDATVWTMATLGVMLLVKAVFDLANGPLFASAWYTVPQRFAICFAAGSVAWLAAIWLLARWRWAGVAAVAGLCFVALPLQGPDVSHSTSNRQPDSSWQEQIDLAASWVRAHGPPGRYAGSDAGLLGYRLDGLRQVVNTDGLVNNYAFADLLSRDAPLPQLLAASGADYYVNRVDDAALRALPCAKVLWTSPGVISTGDGSPGAPIRVLDVRACRAAG